MATMNNLDERSKNDFLVYANSVIKSRAIPYVQDNLKPIHRKILYTMWESKVTPDKPTRKCQTIAGAALTYSPHGDSSVYGAMVRMSQWWKLRYPLIEMQGNCGNLLGDGPAASRYTECRLSPVGMMMLDGINKECVEFKPNYTEETVEPVTLPSKFPYLLCGNNSGIAVGMSSDLVSHNFTEVAGAINYYLDHKEECTIADLMKFIKGPDFPTGGVIINGEDLYNIYATGRGAVRMQAHYDIVKAKGGKTLLIFHDVPYGVELEPGVKEPLKKLVIEDGYEIFEDIDIKKAGPRNFDITITLGKNADIANCLNILFTKTRLANTIKINQTLIVNGEPRILDLKQLIQYWVDYRDEVITNITRNDYKKTNHKLTVTMGLQKCMSDIDLLIKLIRESDSRADAKSKIMKAFELNDEQAEAVLDMKLSRLNRLDLTELNDLERELASKAAALQEVLENQNLRYDIIRQDLKEIKATLGKDERITEIKFSRPSSNQEVADQNEPLVKKEFLVYNDGIVCSDEQVAMNGTKAVSNNLCGVIYAYNPDDIVIFNAHEGQIAPLHKMKEHVTISGAFVKEGDKKDKVVTVTSNGYIKVSDASAYKWTGLEKTIKLKDDDEVLLVDMCNDNDFVILFNKETHAILKLAVKDLPVASKITVGVKSGFARVEMACVVSDSDVLLISNNLAKAKFTSVKDFSVDNRGNKGQLINEDATYVRKFDSAREDIYVIPKTGKVIVANKNKLSLKSRTAAGASLSGRIITNLI